MENREKKITIREPSYKAAVKVFKRVFLDF